MRGKALELIQRLPPGAIVLPVQTLGELFNVLVRKAKRRPARARAALLSWRDAYPLVESVRNRNGQRNGSGVRSWPDDLGLGCAGRVGGSRMSVASIGRSPRGVYVAWSHRDQPVCAGASPAIGGLAHGAGGVISSARVWYCSQSALRDQAGSITQNVGFGTHAGSKSEMATSRQVENSRTAETRASSSG